MSLEQAPGPGRHVWEREPDVCVDRRERLDGRLGRQLTGPMDGSESEQGIDIPPPDRYSAGVRRPPGPEARDRQR